MKISLRHRHAQMIGDGAFSHKIDRFKKMLEILNITGHQNRIIDSKVTAILLNGWVLPFGELHRKGFAPAACAGAGIFFLTFVLPNVLYSDIIRLFATLQ